MCKRLVFFMWLMIIQCAASIKFFLFPSNHVYVISCCSTLYMWSLCIKNGARHNCSYKVHWNSCFGHHISCSVKAIPKLPHFIRHPNRQVYNNSKPSPPLLHKVSIQCHHLPVAIWHTIKSPVTIFSCYNSLTVQCTADSKQRRAC